MNFENLYVLQQGATVLPGNRIMLVGGEGQYNNNTDYKYPKHVNEVLSSAFSFQRNLRKFSCPNFLLMEAFCCHFQIVFLSAPRWLNLCAS